MSAYTIRNLIEQERRSANKMRRLFSEVKVLEAFLHNIKALQGYQTKCFSFEHLLSFNSTGLLCSPQIADGLTDTVISTQPLSDGVEQLLQLLLHHNGTAPHIRYCQN
jgi:hypothetical protein